MLNGKDLNMRQKKRKLYGEQGYKEIYHNWKYFELNFPGSLILIHLLFCSTDV